MSLPDPPEARALPADAVLAPEAVRGRQDRITAFLSRPPPRSYRAEQRAHATLVIRGRLSGPRRKACEPLAVEAGVHREPIQSLAGAGECDDEAVLARSRREVRQVPGDPRAIPIL